MSPMLAGDNAVSVSHSARKWQKITEVYITTTTSGIYTSVQESHSDAGCTDGLHKFLSLTVSGNLVQSLSNAKLVGRIVRI